MRISYWTTASLERGIEAVTTEIFTLAEHFPHSKVFGVSPHIRARVGLHPLHVGLHPRFHPLLRLAIPLIELGGDVNHVYSEMYPWLFDKTLRRKPIVLTIASEKGNVNAEFLDRVDAVTVQTESLRSRLSQVSRWAGKTRLIYPGIDLARFSPVGGLGAASRRVRILLATFPRAREELEPRGLRLLLELAREAPHAEFDVLTRPWATGDTAYVVMKKMLRDSGLMNFRLLSGRRERMEDVYRQYDFTIIPYTHPEGGKECPLSLVEGLGCGLPVLISSAAPFAPFVADNRCGAVFDLNPRSFRSALDSALAQYDFVRANAVSCASMHFDRQAMFRRFAAIYGSASTAGITR